MPTALAVRLVFGPGLYGATRFLRNQNSTSIPDRAGGVCPSDEPPGLAISIVTSPTSRRGLHRTSRSAPEGSSEFGDQETPLVSMLGNL